MGAGNLRDNKTEGLHRAFWGGTMPRLKKGGEVGDLFCTRCELKKREGTREEKIPPKTDITWESPKDEGDKNRGRSRSTNIKSMPCVTRRKGGGD